MRLTTTVQKKKHRETKTNEISNVKMLENIDGSPFKT